MGYSHADCGADMTTRLIIPHFRVAICWKARKTGKALWVWYEVSDLSHNSKTATVKAVRTGQLGRAEKFELNYNKYGVPTEMVTKMGGAGVQGWVIDPRITPL